MSCSISQFQPNPLLFLEFPMCLHAQACHLIQTISSRLRVLDKALQEHEPEYPGVHGLQEDGEKALSGVVRQLAGTGGSRDTNPRDLGAERMGPQRAVTQQILSHSLSNSSMPCPRLSNEDVSPHARGEPIPECSVSALALFPQQSLPTMCVITACPSNVGPALPAGAFYSCPHRDNSPTMLQVPQHIAASPALHPHPGSATQEQPEADKALTAVQCRPTKHKQTARSSLHIAAKAP
ncbi:hypothetical protein TURU_068125 [Turdus rufiventris]|nr:hypothetical protein TURU_068125 [Turdus rufiventris]